ncbi:hypothetical protein H8D29_00585 [PVC group bacterium]|nr:hypothetical protein [PVC group bacterium]
MPAEKTPRLVIIVSDGPLIVGNAEELANRSAIHIPVSTPPIPLAAIATTVATGVNPLVHGIITAVTVDAETEDVRDAVASDRRFQAFWTNSDLKTSLINWPATKGELDVTSIESDYVFKQAKECMDSDVIGLVVPSKLTEISPPEKVKEQQAELESFLSTFGKETSVIIVHKRTSEKGTVPNAVNPLSATFLIDGCQYESKQAPFIEVIGGAAYLLAGIPSPVGVKLPRWPFIVGLHNTAETRTFPIASVSDETDWKSVIKDSKEVNDPKVLAVLIQRFTTLVSVSFKKKMWKELEYNSECLKQLRGNPMEWWLVILALHQQGKMEEMAESIAVLEEQFPKKFITAIAKSLLLFDSKPEEAKELLKEINPKRVAVFHALGTLGRICLRVGLEDKAVEAIELAIEKRTVIPADRARLANYLAQREEYGRALKSLGRVGINGDLSWQELRLHILLDLNMKDQAKQIASNILQKHPAHQEALSVIG